MNAKIIVAIAPAPSAWKAAVGGSHPVRLDTPRATNATISHPCPTWRIQSSGLLQVSRKRQPLARKQSSEAASIAAQPLTSAKLGVLGRFRTTKSIARARIPTGASGIVEVESRNKHLRAEVVKLPFVREGKSTLINEGNNK